MTGRDLRAALEGIPDDTPAVVALPGGLRVVEEVDEALYRPTVRRQESHLSIAPQILLV